MPKIWICRLDDVLFSASRLQENAILGTQFDDHPELVNTVGIIFAARSWINVFRATAPDRPTAYRRGQLVEAEPALPGWTFPVDDLFD